MAAPRWMAHWMALDASAAKETPIVLHMPESLDKVIAHRVKLLSAYQDSAYARRYLALVERIRATEKGLGGVGGLGDGARNRLTTVIARNLAKLMAYKDEYEVARLYAAPEFLDKMRAQFEGEPGKDYQLKFHLAPPLLARKNAQDQLIKQDFGAWMLPAFRLLTRFKRLRATPFDIFGYTEERKSERALIAGYVELINEFGLTLSGANIEAAIQLANIPDEIRGYGHVKEASMAVAAKKRARLLEQYRAAQVAAA